MADTIQLLDMKTLMAERLLEPPKTTTRRTRKRKKRMPRTMEKSLLKVCAIFICGASRYVQHQSFIETVLFSPSAA